MLPSLAMHAPGGLHVLLLLALLAFGAVCTLWLLAGDRQQHLRNRIAAVSRLHGTVNLAPAKVELQWYHRLGAMLSNSPLVGQAERNKLADALARAGFRADRAVLVFIAAKFACLLIVALAAVLLAGSLGFFQEISIVEICIVLAAAILGWRVPDVALARLTRLRRRAVEAGLADAVDLLVICAEAGLSLEMAIERVRRDLHAVHPALSEELRITIAEMRLLSDRRAALENLATRTGLRSIRGIVTTLSQSVRYGTSLAASLRTIAGELRQARLLRIDERVGRLPVLLTLPMIVFILPCLFMIVAGPAAFDLIDTITAQ